MFPTSMDEAEKMVALKKAYAEIILNTSKEAAARVMAAERKAQRFEQDLFSTREEALRMLLRMKQLVDNQNNEAQITSLNHKRRINELEAQLDEAEGLIIDLRAKLSQVQDQLEDTNSKYMHSLRQKEQVSMPSQNMTYSNEQICLAPFKSFSELESEAVTSEIQASASEESIMDHECLPSVKGTARANTDFEHHPMQKPVFPSIITRSKEPELLRNRCNQRICAIETGLVDVKLHSAHDIVSLLENISTTRRKEKNEVIASLPVSRTNKLGELDIFTEEAALVKDDTADAQPVSLRKMRRRRTRYGRVKATPCKYRSGQIVKPRQTSFAISRCKSHSHSSNDVHRPGRVSTSTRNTNEVDYTCELEEKVHLAKHPTVSGFRRSVRKRKIKHWDGFATSCKPNGSRSHGYDKPCYADKAVKCDEKENEDLMEVDVGELEEGICIRAASADFTTCMNSGESLTFLGNVAEKNTRSIDESKSENRDELASESRLKDASLVFSDLRDIKASEMTDKVPSQQGSKMPIKYTFSRKRKAASTSLAENKSFQQSSIKKRPGQENENELAPESNNCINESSPDGRRLVQVARQLISLSGKRKLSIETKGT